MQHRPIRGFITVELYSRRAATVAGVSFGMRTSAASEAPLSSARTSPRLTEREGTRKHHGRS